MYSVKFSVKDLDGFSFSVEQMDKVLRPDARQDNGDSFLMESVDKAMTDIVRCDFCYGLQKLGDLADIIVTDRTDANGFAITYNMCVECKERQAFENDAVNLQSELDIKTSPKRYHPGAPERFHQRHNPGGPDENPTTPAPRVELGLRVFTPCEVCAGQGEIVSFTGEDGKLCEACAGMGEDVKVVSLNAVLSAQGVSFNADDVMRRAFELAKCPF